MAHNRSRAHRGSLLAQAVGAVCAVALLAACSPWTGPFDGYYRTGENQPWGWGTDAGGAGTHCTPRPERSVFTSTSYGLSNDTGGDLTLDRVKLVEPRNLTLLRSGAFEVGKDTDGVFLLPGVSPGFPPTGPEEYEQAVGKTFHAAPGAVVPPHDDEEQSYGLAVELRLNGPGPARYEAIEVEYHDTQGRAYRSHVGNALELLAQGVESCF